MKLTIKTLSQYTFKVEAEPELTVKELKDKIEREQGKEYQVAFQKLIYSGKILADESKLSEYQIDEKKFIVLMVTRPPPPPKPAPIEAPKQAPKIAASKPEEHKSSADDKTKPNTRLSVAPSAATSNTNQQASSTPNTTAAAPAATAAPAPASTNTAAATAAAARQPPRATSQMPTDGLNQSQLMHRLANFMNQPEFRQMQDLIQQSPHLLSSTIEALAGSNPDIYNLITENPDAFVAALNHPPTSSMPTHGSRGPMGGFGGGGGGGGASELLAGGSGPAIEQILPGVSEHDKEAIERLKELGFSEYLAVQAYMACDKDEQLAANLLFQMEQ